MSTLNVSNISDGTDTVETGYVVNGSAKAWANMNGLGTVAIRDSVNVSSITDNGTGDYTVNYANSMSNTNHSFSFNAVSAGYSDRSGGFIGTKVTTLGNSNPKSFYSTSSHTISYTYASNATASGSPSDVDVVCLHVFGDLA